MDFFINKASTLPIMKLDLIQDGRNDFNKFYDKLQNSDIFFCMTDIITGNKKIGRKKAMCILKEPSTDCDSDGYDQYYVAYQFSEKETNTPGTYIGQFFINFLDGAGELIVPIRDTLYIHVLDHGIKK